MPSVCHIRIFRKDAKPYFQVRCSGGTLHCCHAACFPYRVGKNRQRCCLGLLRSLMDGCSLLQLEGLSLLPPGSRRRLLAFCADYAGRERIPLLVL